MPRFFLEVEVTNPANSRDDERNFILKARSWAEAALKQAAEPYSFGVVNVTVSGDSFIPDDDLDRADKIRNRENRTDGERQR